MKSYLSTALIYFNKICLVGISIILIKVLRMVNLKRLINFALLSFYRCIIHIKPKLFENGNDCQPVILYDKLMERANRREKISKKLKYRKNKAALSYHQPKHT